MNDHPIVFAMANPDAEITPEDAYEAGAYIVGTVHHAIRIRLIITRFPRYIQRYSRCACKRYHA
jgi:hypothetical protein